MRNLFILITLLVLTVLFGCAVIFPTTDTNRRIRVKIVADRGFSSETRWRSNVENMIGVADIVFQSCAEVRLEIDTMVAWDVRSVPESVDLPLVDCLMKHIPKGNADLVIYLSKTNRDEAYITNAESIEFGYIVVTQLKTTEDSGYEEAYIKLVQSLGFMFGALRKRGYHADGPDFTDGNIDVMVSLSKRPFSGETWDSTLWESIHNAYADVRKTYNPWKFSPTGKIVNHQDNVYAEGDAFLFVSLFASFCGKHDLALAYLDSTEVTYRAKWNTCMREKAGNVRLCTDCGNSHFWADGWLARRLYEVDIFRATTMLRAGREREASVVIEEMVDRVSMISKVSGRRLFNHFEFLKNLYRTDSDPALSASAKTLSGNLPVSNHGSR